MYALNRTALEGRGEKERLFHNLSNTLHKLVNYWLGLLLQCTALHAAQVTIITHLSNYLAGCGCPNQKTKSVGRSAWDLGSVMHLCMRSNSNGFLFSVEETAFLETQDLSQVKLEEKKDKKKRGTTAASRNESYIALTC